jgi:TolB-like protein/Tfp pilus assembly protein PilF
MPGQPLIFGPFRLNADNGTLFRDGELVPVGQKGVLLLKALLESPGQVRTKAELMEAAWPGAAIEESNLSVQIATLRKLLGPLPDGGEWIATVPRVGYRLVGMERPASAEPRASGAGQVIPSLAVLPFENLGGSAEQDYFADGIVEEIITALSRFRSFAVIARNSSFAYKGRAIDVRQVAAEVGVRYVLEGSVRRAGERLRIAAQLVDGATGAHLWAEKYDGTVADVFDFQDMITERVATAVEPQIQQAEIERSRLERPESIAAYDLHLQALPLLYAETDESNRRAYGLLTRAVALEPDHAVILGELAWTLTHRKAMGWGALGDDDRENVDYARRALRHAAGDAVVMASCAFTTLLHISGEYDLALAVARSAAEANPNSLTVVLGAGIVFLHCGDVDEALAFFHRAIRLSPRDPAAHYSLTGIAHGEMIRGNYAEALVWATRSLVVNAQYPPTHWMLIAANAQLGRMDEARRLLRDFLAIVPSATISAITAGQPAKDPSRIAAILEGLRRAGLAEG